MIIKRIPARPDLGHLKKQAKQLLADHRSGLPCAFERFRAHLPAARGLPDDELAAMPLRLHDAQSCLAREHGFPSWAELAGFVEARLAQAQSPGRALMHWLALVYAGDIADGTHRARPRVAARLWREQPHLLGDDPHLACAVGDLDTLRRATVRDPGWVLRAGGPLLLPPLVAVAHSGLL